MVADERLEKWQTFPLPGGLGKGSITHIMFSKRRRLLSNNFPLSTGYKTHVP